MLHMAYEMPSYVSAACSLNQHAVYQQVEVPESNVLGLQLLESA